VVDPYVITDKYDPVVEDELLSSIGEFKDDDMLILVTLTVPSDITKLITKRRLSSTREP
jgi:flagellar assembly factor FliW